MQFLFSIFIAYLRVNKEKFWIWGLYFEAETEEITEDYKTWWFIDIKIWNINPGKLVCDENEYFTFECKRLDWYATKNNEYINNGLSRFIKWQYSKKMNIAWMIGFVQWFKKWKTIDNLVGDLEKRISGFNKYIVDDFNHAYHSNHERAEGLWKIDIYHLLFDFTEKI